VSGFVLIVKKQCIKWMIFMFNRRQFLKIGGLTLAFPMVGHSNISTQQHKGTIIIFLAGGPGSGKSFIGKSVTGGMGFKFITSDQAFEMFLKKANMSLKLNKMKPEELKAALAHRDSAKALTDKIQSSHEAGRLGLIFDGTGQDYTKIKHNVDLVRKLGYDVYMIYVNTTLEVALDRNRKRSRNTPK